VHVSHAGRRAARAPGAEHGPQVGAIDDAVRIKITGARRDAVERELEGEWPWCGDVAAGDRDVDRLARRQGKVGDARGPWRNVAIAAVVIARQQRGHIAARCHHGEPQVVDPPEV
ncbi:MAG: hypothetical protein ACK55I_05620, partial [bacterium]